MNRFLNPIYGLVFACCMGVASPAYGQDPLRAIAPSIEPAPQGIEQAGGDRSSGSTPSPNPSPGEGNSSSYLFHGTDYQNASVELFTHSPSSARSSALSAEIEAYDLLELNAEAAAQLLAESPARLELSLPSGDRQLGLVLHQVDLVADGFSVREATSDRLLGAEAIGIHYRGHLQSDPSVPVAFSLSEGAGIRALIALPDQNLVLGPLADQILGPDTYVLYADDQLEDQASFTCHTADNEVAYEREQLEINPQVGAGRSNNSCVRIYLEVDHDIYLNKGGTAGASAYISAAFNEVAALYQAINVNLTISEILVWNTPSPYTASSSSGRLSTFQSTRTSFNGDLAQLLSFGASGGIAVLNGLCHPFNGAKMSFSSIGTTFNAVPTYSWTVMVMAHEFGHQLGSQHTHACVWNGNGTAIDGCPNFTEGSCPVPGTPQGGGNIMSYCHLDPVGINFNVGLGQQPAAVIVNTVNAASCLTGTCGGNPPPPPPVDCADNTVVLRLAPDNYGPETEWRVSDEAGDIVASGGPYGKMLSGTLVFDTLCLVNGCYDFQITDSYGDGICCEYGEGSIRLTAENGDVIFDNEDFEDEFDQPFCVPFDDDPSGDDCLTIDFNTYPPISYGLNQDNGQVSVQQQGTQIYLRNNAWKAIELPYTLTPETVIEFDFRSTIQGEIHGIGFDNNLSISAQFTMQLYGTQNWGNSAYANYNGSGQWQQFTIPIGQFLTGDAQYMFFVADHDNGLRNGNSYFRNIRMYEGSPCSNLGVGSAQQTALGTQESTGLEIDLWPNPTGGQIQISRPAQLVGRIGNYTLSSTDGRTIHSDQIGANTQQLNIDLTDQPPGSYLLRYTDGQVDQTIRFQLLSTR
ncbi:MAG: zinc-dependent metalloprotease [Bacteroidota bacterium]